MTELPNWVYDLVMDLQEQEAIHPPLYQVGITGGWIRRDWCPTNALEKVPAEVQQAAEAIRGYRSRESDKSIRNTSED